MLPLTTGVGVYPDYPDAVGSDVWAGGSRVQERREEVLQQPWAEDVGAHLQFVALGVVSAERRRRRRGGIYLGGLGPAGGKHEACVVPDNIETRFLLEERLCGGLHGGQVGEVDVEELYRALGGRVRAADSRDGDVGVGLRAARDVDGCRFGVEDLRWCWYLAEREGGRGEGGLLCRAPTQRRMHHR